MKNSRAKPIGILVVIVVIVILVFTLWPSSKKPSPNTNSTSSNQATHPSIVFQHPNWSAVELTTSDVSQGVIARLSRANPDATLLIRQAAVNSNTTTSLNQTATDTVNALQSQVQGFKLISSNVQTVSGTGVIHIVYGQTTGNTSENSMTIISMNGQAYYLVYTTSAGKIQTINNDIQTIDADFIAYLKG